MTRILRTNTTANNTNDRQNVDRDDSMFLIQKNNVCLQKIACSLKEQI